jgi:photosystem II stability/assembly factor-like uncharacterized protein
MTLMRLCLLLLLSLFSLAGGQWKKIDVPTTASLRGLSVVDANTVWASGTGGTVIKTVDGGTNWSVMTVPGAEKLDFRGIRAFDDKTAVIMSSGLAQEGQAQIYLTQDGGKNWSRVYEQKTPGIFFDAIAFWDRKHGIVVSDPVDGHFALFRTDDGGASWKQISPASLPASLPNEGAFAASNSCLVVQGDKNVWFATGGAKMARVFRSADRGASWTVAETPIHPANSSSGIFSLAFRDARNGVAVGGDYAHPQTPDLPSVLVTGDGGQTWRPGVQTQPPGVYLSSVVFLTSIEGDNLLAGGIGGLFLYVGGFQWRKMGEDNINSVGLTAGSRSKMPQGGSEIWVVGPKGFVRHVSFQVDFRPN